MVVKTTSFAKLLDEYENMIYYLINKLGIRDDFGEFYQEGVIALWKAAKTFNEEQGKFSSYAYFLIEKALISLIRKRIRQTTYEQDYIEKTSKEENLTTNLELPFDPYLLYTIKQTLTANQWTWFRFFVLEDWSINEIARKEKVSLDAVKGWARLAKPKIKQLLRND